MQLQDRHRSFPHPWLEGCCSCCSTHFAVLHYMWKVQPCSPEDLGALLYMCCIVLRRQGDTVNYAILTHPRVHAKDCHDATSAKLHNSSPIAAIVGMDMKVSISICQCWLAIYKALSSRQRDLQHFCAFYCCCCCCAAACLASLASRARAACSSSIWP